MQLEERKWAIELADLEQLIKTRRSTRAWEDRDVPDDLIRKAIELGTWTANAGNYQGWQFVVVKNRELMVRMANAIWQRTDVLASWPEALAIGNVGEMVERSRQFLDFIRHAPALVCVLCDPYVSNVDRVAEARFQNAADSIAGEMMEARSFANPHIESAAGAIAYMLLAFHHMGLGACWMTGPVMRAKRPIEEIIGAEPPMQLMALVPVGYPAEAPESHGRKPVDEVVRFIP